jgi:hypothetical protein
VDKDSIKFDVEPGTQKYRNGTIAFAVKKGESFDLKGLAGSLKTTRLGGGTRSGVNYLEITVAGELAAGDKETTLKVAGTGQQFVLGDDPKADPKADKKTPYQRLRDAVTKGEKITNVTGRVQGWNGVWPEVLRELSKEPAQGEKKLPVLVVTDFEVAKS